MSNMFHQAPDGFIYVRVEGKDLYRATPDEFSSDFREILRPLPPRATERIYEPPRRHAIMDRESVLEGGAMPYNLGDRAIAAIDDLLEKMHARQQKEEEEQEEFNQRIMAAAPNPQEVKRIMDEGLRRALQRTKVLTTAEVLEVWHRGEPEPPQPPQTPQPQQRRRARRGRT